MAVITAKTIEASMLENVNKREYWKIIIGINTWQNMLAKYLQN